MIDLRSIEGLPYRAGGNDPASGVDCLWASRKALERMFPDFEPAELPVTPEEIEAAVVPASSHTAEWRQVPRATHAGDLIHGEKRDGTPWVAVLVDPVGGIAFTALPRFGTCLRSVRALHGIRRVFRRHRRA